MTCKYTHGLLVCFCSHVFAAVWCDCRSNFAPFYSHWDSLMGSNSTPGSNARAPSALLIAAHICYAAALHGGLLVLLWKWPLHTLAAYIVAYVLVSPQTAAAAFNVLRLPESVRAVFGGLMDA